MEIHVAYFTHFTTSVAQPAGTARHRPALWSSHVKAIRNSRRRRRQHRRRSRRPNAALRGGTEPRGGGHARRPACANERPCSNCMRGENGDRGGSEPPVVVGLKLGSLRSLPLLLVGILVATKCLRISELTSTVLTLKFSYISIIGRCKRRFISLCNWKTKKLHNRRRRR